MKYRVGFRELGSTILGCHGNDLRLLRDVFNTREEALKALYKDMEDALDQYKKGCETTYYFLDRSEWVVGGNYDDGEDFRCEWSIHEDGE